MNTYSRRLTTRRLGFTIGEMVAAMAIASVILGMLGMLVSQLYRMNDVATHHLESMVALGRLGDQFRDDAHAVRQATVELDKLKLVVAGGGEITYEITAQGVDRLATAPSGQPRRESFLMPGFKVQGFANTDGELSLRLGRTTGLEDNPVRPWLSLRGRIAEAVLPEAAP